MQSEEPSPQKPIRLDKWLKISRIYKTRAIAARACEEGRVKVNGNKAKAARLIRIGDEVTIRIRGRYRTFDVLDIVFKSISNKEAKSLYQEHKPKIAEESQELYELLQHWDEVGRRKYKGRPTKKERRDMNKIRGF